MGLRDVLQAEALHRQKAVLATANNRPFKTPHLLWIFGSHSTIYWYAMLRSPVVHHVSEEYAASIFSIDYLKQETGSKQNRVSCLAYLSFSWCSRINTLIITIYVSELYQNI
jgi:hypothetical protein